MTADQVRPSGIESHFGKDEIIVSKTDLKGIITYANEVFARVSGYSEAELLGRPHNIIRHPAMPRCVFKLLWDTIEARQEVFAYVVNLARTGNHYWVLAHVTPTLDQYGRSIGYHSNRRSPSPEAVRVVEPLYRELLAVEQARERRDGMAASTAMLTRLLQDTEQTYDQFIWSLIAAHEGKA